MLDADRIIKTNNPPIEILFIVGSGVDIAAGESAVSDWQTYSIDETKDYLLIYE